MQEKLSRYCELKEEEKKIKKELDLLSAEIKEYFDKNGITEEKTDKNRLFINEKVTGWTYSESLVKELEKIDQKKIDEQEQKIAVPRYSVSLNIRDLKE